MSPAAREVCAGQVGALASPPSPGAGADPPSPRVSPDDPPLVPPPMLPPPPLDALSVPELLPPLDESPPEPLPEVFMPPLPGVAPASGSGENLVAQATAQMPIASRKTIINVDEVPVICTIPWSG